MTDAVPGGYTLLYRALWTNPMFAGEGEAAIFAWMISMAQWRPTTIRTKFGPVYLDTGELIFAENNLARQFLLHRNQVRKVIQHMIDGGAIAVKRHKHLKPLGTIASIVNYKVYQGTDCIIPIEKSNPGTVHGTNSGQARAKLGTQNNHLNHLNPLKEEGTPSELCPRQPGGGVDLLGDVVASAVVVPMPKREAEEAVELWNATAADLNLATVRNLSTDRRRKLVLRLKEGSGIEGWKAALDHVRNSRLLRGEAPGKNGGPSWACTFDFLVSQSGFTRVMEGNYRDRGAPPGQGAGINHFAGLTEKLKEHGAFGP